MPKPIKLQAAHRLKVMAAADEQLARTYLKEVAGVEVGKLYHSSPSQISFFLTPEQFQVAKRNLSKRFKWIPTKVFNSAAGSVKIDDTGTREIALSENLMVGNAHHSQPWIALYDTNHKETVQMMMRRILGKPPVQKR